MRDGSTYDGLVRTKVINLKKVFLKHGQGKQTLKDKSEYDGMWKNGKKDGQGSYIFEATKMKFVGQFKAGQLTVGKWQYPNGSYFDGRFDNNQPKGHGEWHF